MVSLRLLTKYSQQYAISIRSTNASYSSINGKQSYCTAIALDQKTNITYPIAAHDSPIELKNKSVSLANLYKFFTVNNETFDQIYKPFIHPEHNRLLKLFGTKSILVRDASVETIQLLNDIEESKASKSDNALLKSVPKFVLHGQPGSGISTEMAHICHYLKEKDAIVFTFPLAEAWMKRTNDLAPCDEYHRKQHVVEDGGDIFDMPERSAEWLRNFLNINPCMTKRVEWTRKEDAPEGTPWINVINFALARAKYANDCIGILLREARILSETKNIPFYLMIDGVNVLWTRGTIIKDPASPMLYKVDRFSIVHHLKRALKADWSNGAVICSTNPRGAWPTDREDHSPGYLLTKVGFEALNPFIPIKVDSYNEVEFEAMMEFYKSNRWITRPNVLTTDGKNQIKFLSDGNLKELFKVVAEL